MTYDSIDGTQNLMAECSMQLWCSSIEAGQALCRKSAANAEGVPNVYEIEQVRP